MQFVPTLVCYLNGCVLCVQGFGNVGAWAAEILTEMGGRVIAVSDAFGCLQNEKGLDIKALRCEQRLLFIRVRLTFL